MQRVRKRRHECRVLGDPEHHHKHNQPTDDDHDRPFHDHHDDHDDHDDHDHDYGTATTADHRATTPTDDRGTGATTGT